MPARLNDIARALKEYGATIDEPSGGSHFKAHFKSKMYTIPAQSAMKTEISDVYIRRLCKEFGIDYKEFVKKL